jgi:hypothetical protein
MYWAIESVELSELRIIITELYETECHVNIL